MEYSKSENGMKRSEAYKLIEDFDFVLGEHFESWKAWAIEHPEKLDWCKMTCLDLHPFAVKMDEVFDFIIDNYDFALFEKLSDCMVWIRQLNEIADNKLNLLSNELDILHDDFLINSGEYFERLNPIIGRLFNVGKLLEKVQKPPERKEEFATDLPKDDFLQNEKLEMIKGYFNFPIWGRPISEADGDRTCFDLLIEELKRPRKKLDLAKVLLFVYESKAMNRHKKPSFSVWLSVWADYLGIGQITYKQNRLDTNGLESVFYFLNK